MGLTVIGVEGSCRMERVVGRLDSGRPFWKELISHYSLRTFTYYYRLVLFSIRRL